MSGKSSLRPFELAPAIQHVHLPEGDKVVCVELSGEIVFIGTKEGNLIQYHFEEVKAPQELRGGIADVHLKPLFNSTFLVQKSLGPKSPVTFVRSASALNRLLVLCDGVLSVLSMTDLTILNLNGSSKLKGLTSCCINENSLSDNPFSVQICIAKKKQIVICNITEEQISVEKVCDLSDQVTKVAMDGVFVCASLFSHYIIYNVSSGEKQELFPVEGTPVIARVAKDEFLLSAPGGLGMFVTSQGLSERPPIQWSKPAFKFIQCPPYIIALSREGILIHSILDQQQKQFLHFSGGETVGNFDGKILVAASSSVYVIHPIPVEFQIKTLLDNGNVEEALNLAENSHQRGISSKEQFQQILNQVRCKAGFVCLKNLQLEKSLELFINGELDPRELISLYPRLLPSSSSFVRSVPPLHEYADITSVTKNDQSIEMKLTDFLIGFLETLRQSQNPSYLEEIDTALVKLYSQYDPDKLQSLFSKIDLKCDISDTKKCLEQCKRHHFLALFHFRNSCYDQGFSLWSTILKGNLNDPYFPGLDFFAEKLLKCPDAILWRYSEFVLEQNEIKGAEIFIRKFCTEKSEEKGESVLHDRVLNFIEKHSKAHLHYLEHIVHSQNSEIGKYHDMLASSYFEIVQYNEGEEVKQKFRDFILGSTLYNPTILIEKVESSNMNEEKAILYGKMGDYDKALKIFVHELGGPKAAEKYCNEITASLPKKAKENIFLSLLKIYLSPECSDSNSNLAMDLINRRSDEFNPLEVVKIMPGDWSIASVLPGLTNLLIKSSESARSALIKKGLAKAENTNVTMEYRIRSQVPIQITESSYCMVCQKSFKKPEFARYPNGMVVHLECARDRKICPVTGTMF